MAAKIQRTKPLTITEQQRRWMVQYGTGEQAIGAQELVTTSDQQRLFRRDTYLGAVDHGTVDTVAALATIYLLPSCTRGVWPADTCWVTSQGCEYRCISGNNATAVWRAVGAGQGAAGTATWGGIVGDIEVQTDLGALFAGKANATHGHAMSDVDGLAAALDGKWDTPGNASVLLDLADDEGALTYRGTPLGGGTASYGISARVRLTSPVSIPSATETAIPFAEAMWDTGGFWSTGSPTIFTIPAAGIYLVGGQLMYYSGSTSGLRVLDILINGSPERLNRTQLYASPVGGTAINVTAMIALAAGDTVSLGAWQNSGGAVDAYADSGIDATSMYILRSG